MKRLLNAVAAAVAAVLTFISCSKPGFDFDCPYIEDGQMHLCIGDSRLVNVVPEDVECEWSSSDEKVATVSLSGRVAAVSEGQCTITASVGKGSRSFELFVTAAQISDFKLPGSVSVLMTQETVIPVTGIVPSNGIVSTIDWRINDPSVAEIQKVSQKGITVAGLTVGKTFITGSIRVGGGIVARECDISVTGPKLSLTPASSNLTAGKTVQLTLTQSPHFSDVVTWSSDDEAIAKVDNKGLVTAGDKSGEATITASIGIFEATAKVNVEGNDYKIKIVCAAKDNHFNFVPAGLVDSWSSNKRAFSYGSPYVEQRLYRKCDIDVKCEDGTDLFESVRNALRWTPDISWAGTLPFEINLPESISGSGGDFLFENGIGRLKVTAPNGSEASVTCSPKIVFHVFKIVDPGNDFPKMEYVAEMTSNVANMLSFTGGTQYLVICVSNGNNLCYPLTYTCSNMGGTMNWSKKVSVDNYDRKRMTYLECGTGHYVIHIVPFDSVDNKEMDSELGYVNLNITVTE